MHRARQARDGDASMSQLFHRASNAYAKASIFVGLFFLAAGPWLGWELYRSSYTTEVDVVRHQPVPFSHEHHVSGLGIDCRFCHTSVERSAFAGLPATQICMGCHKQIWKDSPMLEPVRASLRSGQPLAWTRVHDLPDFVYFDHSIHVAKGVGCESCHGAVNEMPLVRKVKSLHMEFCLDCHRHPESQLRQLADVTHFGGGVQSVSLAEGESMVRDRGIVTEQLTNCAVCHR